MAKLHKRYACIDIKSYYANVECLDLGLNPLTTNLVVADESRSDGTICLAVPPSVHGTGKLGHCLPQPDHQRGTPALRPAGGQGAASPADEHRSHPAVPEGRGGPQLTFYADRQDDGRETALLEATIGLHRRYGKNAVVKGMDLLEAGTTRERNSQIGGHRK